MKTIEMNSYLQFYNTICGFSPYIYQTEVANLLLSGKNVILSVPTGAGKTWASVMPFLYAKENNVDNFPQKMIYSLPLRTLANSIYNDTIKAMSDENVVQKFPALGDLASIQTGEYSNDSYFEKEIVFSTIDQTLSNFLCFPLDVSHSQANINAGSIVGSYLVFDEFHLLDSKLSMATTLGMIRMLRNLCRVCIMTATLTDDYIKFLKKELIDFEVVSIQNFEEDKKRIKSLIPVVGKSIKKAIHICDGVLDSKMILEKHSNKTIVICNRVETAQKIFCELKDGKKQSTEVLCIHSRFFDSDRKEKESLLKEYFGKESIKKDVILVATQVIEAGMDISCDVMFTEIAPVNSFLQRAGRCARFANEYGDIFICDVLSLEEKERILVENVEEQDKQEIKLLNNKYLPYSKELCEKSLEAIRQYDSLDETIATELVNTVMKDSEHQQRFSIVGNQYNLEKIRQSWHDCDKKHYRETIRDIQSLEIALIDVDSKKDCKIIPWAYETIGVYKWSFIGWAKKMIQNKINEDDWIFAKAEQSSDSQFDFDWGDKEDYLLKRLDFNDLKNHYDVIFVDNRYFDYNEAGLMVLQNTNGKESPIKESIKKEKEQITFKKDTFYQHNKALLNCYEMEFKPNMKFIFSQLDKFWGNHVDWDKLIKLTICFHDYGKLNNAWQIPMLNFQRKKMNDETYFEVLAHTDYDAKTDKELGNLCGINRKPPHAGIGAVQAYDLLFDEYGERVARVVSCAILKHHNVDTESFVSYSITEKNMIDLKRLFNDLQFKGDFNKQDRGDNLSDLIPTNEGERLLYFLVVRILRLCDQRATKIIDKYYTI